ncbi:MAG: SDR family NAD(P)-dependent oxidoreductase [Sciscionella sp.]
MPTDPRQAVEPTEVRHDQLFRLDGRTYLIAGAGAGIGEHVSRTIAALGARLVCVDVDAARVGAVADSLDARHIVADVTTEEGVASVRESVEDRGEPLDGYVDVVGQMQRKPLPEFTLAEWEQDFRVNLRHAFLLSQSLAPLIARSDAGSIVHVSSVMGAHAGRKSPGYGPAKAALETWVKQLAAEYGPAGVRVNAVAPGLFLSPRFLAKQNGTRVVDALAAKSMLGRLGQPFEIAATVAFLLTPAAGYITASTLSAEGGARSVDSTGLDDLPL